MLSHLAYQYHPFLCLIYFVFLVVVRILEVFLFSSDRIVIGMIRLAGGHEGILDAG